MEPLSRLSSTVMLCNLNKTCIDELWFGDTEAGSSAVNKSIQTLNTFTKPCPVTSPWMIHQLSIAVNSAMSHTAAVYSVFPPVCCPIYCPYSIYSRRRGTTPQLHHVSHGTVPMADVHYFHISGCTWLRLFIYSVLYRRTVVVLFLSDH